MEFTNYPEWLILRNFLKAKLKSGEAVIGTFVGLGHPDVTERLSRLGFDWLLLDGEHSPLGLETLLAMMQAMNGASMRVAKLGEKW